MLKPVFAHLQTRACLHTHVYICAHAPALVPEAVSDQVCHIPTLDLFQGRIPEPGLQHVPDADVLVEPALVHNELVECIPASTSGCRCIC